MRRSFLFFIALFVSFSLPISSASSREADVLRLAVFPTGTAGESYYFGLSEKGVLFCAFGVRESDDIQQPTFLRRIDQSSVAVLSASNFEVLLGLCEELEKGGYPSPQERWADSWEVALLYNDRVYEINYFYNDGSQALIDLVNRLIEVSPIPVDLHGWA